MRIGLLIDLAPRKLGSLELWLLALAAEARRRGHQLDVFGREPRHPEFTRRLEDQGGRWTPVDDLLRQPARSVIRLARRFDVLHVNLFAPRHPAALMAYAAWPARVLFVDHFSGAPNSTLARESVVHALVDRATLLRVRGFAGVSRYVRDRATRRFRIPPGKARTTYLGIDVNRFQPDVERREPAAITVMTVAYLIPEKGVDYLLRAFAHVKAPNARVVIVGDGPEGVRLRELSEQLSINDRVTFLGLRDDVPDLLKTAHVFVHPCLWEEALGLGVLEAMASGCAVVASRIGAIPEIVDDGVNGLLVPPGDENLLTHALERLTADLALQARLGAAARRVAVERFDLQSSVRVQLDWCEEASASRG